jgi:hypothetical protein
MKLKMLSGMGISAAALLVGSIASAQEPAAGASGSASGTASASAPPAVVVAQPAAAVVVEPAKRVEDDTPDHERFVGHFAVGYFGISQLPIAHENPGAGGVVRDNVNAPIIGVRYWLKRDIGLDLGLGLGLTGGSTEIVSGGAGGGSTTVDKKSLFGLGIHGGVPLAFAHGRHYSFLVLPEATLGFTSGTLKSPANGAGVAAPDQDLSGFKLDVGARVGAEIHFGFIGIPELSLEGSVGLFARRETVKWKQDTASASDGTTTFSTSVQSDPWAIFVNNISAFYYF